MLHLGAREKEAKEKRDRLSNPLSLSFYLYRRLLKDYIALTDVYINSSIDGCKMNRNGVYIQT